MKTLLTFIICLFTGTVFAQPDLEIFALDFTDPVDIANAGDNRLFIVEQGGLIKILETDGSTEEAPFLDINGLISSGGERGLLGLAFHPDYSTNGYFFVDYTNTSGNTVISRFTVSGTNSNMADPESEVILLTIEQPFSNHNGGCLRFGPDGYLYIATGDGGSGGDPNNNAQNLNSYLGKILRINVMDDGTYTIPEDNPFAETEGLDEIWAYGLRNPWKFSFDTAQNNLWIADVGQNAIEEINLSTTTQAGLNYGWRCYEGSVEYDMSQCDDAMTTVNPFFEYTHADTGGCSITGGYVYNGTMYPSLQGMYFFADYCSNKVGMLDSQGAVVYTSEFTGNNFTTFGEDAEGELYIAGKASGTIYKLRDPNFGTPDYGNPAFSIYPNPATDYLHIENNGLVALPTQAYVYDMGGKELINEQLENIEINDIDISGLSSGLYILALTDESGTKYNYKLSIK